jgi:hypothetical protein
MYSADTAEYSDAAAMGTHLAYQPGASTLAFKTLNGITVDSLDSNDLTNIHSKNANSYHSMGGTGSVLWGTTASGEYVDVIRDLDYVNLSIQTAVYALFKTSPKIAFTNPGLDKVVAAVDGVVKRMEFEGIFAKGTTRVSFPDVADVSTTNKNNRLLPDITFNATLSGAIHKVIPITGLVAV